MTATAALADTVRSRRCCSQSLLAVADLLSLIADAARGR
jgi:hypothetical protein